MSTPRAPSPAAGDEPPVVLVPPGTDPSRYVPEGWEPHDGFDVPDDPQDLGPQRWACVGRILTPLDAGKAVRAAARGAAVVADIGLVGPGRRRALEDLARAGQLVDPEARRRGEG